MTPVELVLKIVWLPIIGGCIWGFYTAGISLVLAIPAGTFAGYVVTYLLALVLGRVFN